MSEQIYIEVQKIWVHCSMGNVVFVIKICCWTRSCCCTLVFSVCFCVFFVFILVGFSLMVVLSLHTPQHTPTSQVSLTYTASKLKATPYLLFSYYTAQIHKIFKDCEQTAFKQNNTKHHKWYNKSFIDIKLWTTNSFRAKTFCEYCASLCTYNKFFQSQNFLWILCIIIHIQQILSESKLSLLCNVKDLA